MNKMKIMTIVGTRPELIKLSRVIPELDKTSNLDVNKYMETLKENPCLVELVRYIHNNKMNINI